MRPWFKRPWFALAGIAALVAAPAVLSQTRTPSPACGALTNLSLPHVVLSRAMIVPASIDPANAHPGYCRVTGASHPTPDSDIRFEVWIPDHWNGRYLQLGNGGFAGTIPEPVMAAGLVQGFAVAGTDDGHQSSDGTDAGWALGHPEKQIDFGYRALKETTDAAKAIITAYAGAPKYSYFQGCSDGGREALTEAQRYPRDFNGIVAGDPANHWTHLFANGLWDYQAISATPAGALPPDKLKLVEAAALKQCGDADGVIQDPLACDFRPRALLCKSGDTPDCLSSDQVAALEKIYAGPRNPRTHEKILSGFSPGGEAEDNGWTHWITGPAGDGKQSLFHAFGHNFFSYIVYGDPNYDMTRFDFDNDLKMTDEKFAPVFNSYDTDLSAFQAHGGKLIQYHGWADPAIPALDSVDYFKSVQARMGATGNFYRLFMAPGMLHCGGGRGPNMLATLPAITAWVEQNKAPDTLIATKYHGDDPRQPVERVRPLCAFPAHAEWNGG
ncbi:MAG TPA: tannase/feruloyl esterase family alpha/beta hydrolase, partial [Rhizomicrobium sp.]|nr:tannase/feruloyl esterase family alpha/beta hydrolase [Rhizomicrobium sp.]